MVRRRGVHPDYADLMRVSSIPSGLEQAILEGKIKSAYEIAMEKAAKLGLLSEEQKGALELVPKGKQIAARLLEGEVDAPTALREIDSKDMPYILKGIAQTLLANLSLPRNEADVAKLQKVLDVLLEISPDRKAMETQTERANYVFQQYSTFGLQQIGSSYDELRQQYSNHFQQELQKEGLSAATLDIESIPEFQAQARAMRVQFESQYEQHLEAIREQIRSFF